MRLPNAKTVAWLTAAALLSLVVYGTVLGYYRDPELLVTVTTVRLVAAFGIGALAGAPIALVMLVRRQPRWRAGFVLSTLGLGSLIVIGLVVFNIAEVL